MKYDIDYPPEPDGPLWDAKGNRWEKTVKGYWEPSDKLDNPYRQSHTWEELLAARRPLYDAPPKETSWDGIQAGRAYYAEIFDPIDGYCPRASGLFLSADGQSLTSAYGRIYRRGEAVVRHLREYGTRQ